MTSLPNKNNIVLRHDYWKGSFRDESSFSNPGVPSGGYWKKTPDKHIQLSGTDVITVADSSELQLTQGTFIVYGDFDNYTLYDRFLSKFDAGGVNYEFYFGSSTTVSLTDSSNTRNATVNWAGSRFVAVSVGAGEIAKAYVDGAFVSNFNAASTLVVNDAPLYIGNNYVGNRPQTNPMKGVIIYNTLLTAAQIAQAYEWTQEQVTPSYPKRNFYVSSSITGRESGLEFACDMEIVSGAVVDKTGNNRNGTPVKLTGDKSAGLKALMFERDNGSTINEIGAVSDFSFVQNTGVFSISCIIEPNSIALGSTQAIIGNAASSGSKGFLLYMNNASVLLQMYRSDAGNYIVNKQWTNALGSVKPSHLVVTGDGTNVELFVDGVSQGTAELGTLSTGDSTGKLQIGAINGGVGFDGWIAELLLYNRTLSDSEVSSLYLGYAKLPYYVDDLKDANESVANVTSGYLENTDWRVSGGGWKIARDETNYPGEKLLKCMATSGTLYLPSQQAYGTWKMKIRKETYGNIMIGIMGTGDAPNATGNNGYALYYHSSDALYLGRMTNGGVSVWVGSPYSLPRDVSYEIEVTRNHSGLFKVYAKGGALTDLTEIISGTDTNYTSSTYFSLYYLINCKFGSLEMYRGVV